MSLYAAVERVQGPSRAIFQSAPHPKSHGDVTCERQQPEGDPEACARDPEHVVPGDARGRDAERELAAEGACEVFDYDFSRERVFLEIAAAEMQAKEAKSEAAAASKLSADEDSDDELAKMVMASHSVSLSSNLSLASNGTPHKEVSHQSAVDDDDDDVAAAIRASLREY